MAIVDNIRHDVQRYIKACGICQKAHHHGKPLPLTQVSFVASLDFHSIQMDV